MKKLLQLVILLFVPALGLAQWEMMHVRVLNGQTGRPVPFQRVLFFGSPTQQERMKSSFAVTTDAQGLASIRVDIKERAWLQAFPDFMTGCTTNPNFVFYNLHEILSTGLSSPNTCSKSIKQQLEPTYLTFFVRKPTLREKMEW